MSKLILKNFTILTEKRFWKRFLKAMSDFIDDFFWKNKLAAFELIFAHSTASLIRKRLILFMYLFDGIRSSILYEASSCFSLQNYFVVDIAFFSKKHSQKVNVGSERFMILMNKFANDEMRFFKAGWYSLKFQKKKSKWIY